MAALICFKPARPGDYPRLGVANGRVERRRLARLRAVRGPIMRPLGTLPGMVPMGNIVRVVPGSVTFSTPGTFFFTVPLFITLIADVNGAGGGGGGGSADCEGCGLTKAADCIKTTGHDINCGGGTDGSGGGASSFNGNVIAGGGGGGTACSNGAGPGAPGGASGGDSNIPGG